MFDGPKNPARAGLRPFTKMGREQRAVAMACLDFDQRPGIPDCSQSIWASLFFEDTSDDRYEDLSRSKHSNVARVFRTHERNGVLSLSGRVREALLSAQESSEKT
jgi:hypothetical protein